MKLFFLSALFLCVRIGAAVELSPDDAQILERRFFESQAKTKTLEADFIQTITAPGLGKPASSSGRFFFQSPGSLRIEYTNPLGDWMQLDGGNFKIARSSQNAITRPAEHPSARVLAALREILCGRKPAEGMHRTIEIDGGIYRVTIKPMRPGSTRPKRISIEASVERFELQSLMVELPRGASMRFDFSDFRRNHPLPSNLFSLE